jgi:hypothetical protein
MYLSGCDYAYLVDDSSLQGFIKSFWKKDIFLGDFLDPDTGAKAQVSSIKLSKMILWELDQIDPSLRWTIYQRSQAVIQSRQTLWQED